MLRRVTRRRLPRILLNAATGVSLVLCLAAAAVWVWGHVGPPKFWDFDSTHRVVLDGAFIEIVRPTGPYFHEFTTIPYGPIGWALALLPAIRFDHWWRRPRPSGLCPACGYDLRATPDRCPECGAAPSAPPLPAPPPA